MNIKEAKEQIQNAMRAYFTKDEYGNFCLPVHEQRPVFLMGPPGIGKTAIMEQIAAELGVAVADAYAKWKALEAEGMDVTENLANYINHPSRELHQLFADALFETLQGEV